MHLERTEAGHCMRVLCIIPLTLMLTVEHQFYWKDSGLAGVEFQLHSMVREIEIPIYRGDMM